MNTAFKSSLAGLFALVGSQIVAHAADLPNMKGPPVVVAPPSWFLFSDTSLSYRIETKATDPGSSLTGAKNIANITHVDAWIYGTNFVSVDALKSLGSFDPANGCTNPNPAACTDGAVELYGIYRGTLSGNALTHSKMFTFGSIIKDISFGFGGDLETDNTTFAPQKRAVVAGPQISFNVPGFLTIQANVYHEWNHNGITEALPGVFPSYATSGGNYYNSASGLISFKTTAEFELAYAQPLTFTTLPLSITGFANVILPKGTDGFGNYTKTEFLTAHRLVLDVGSYFGRAKTVDLFVGYKLWLNKFGNNDTFGSAGYTPGSHESQFFAGLAVHLN